MSKRRARVPTKSRSQSDRAGRAATIVLVAAAAVSVVWTLILAWREFRPLRHGSGRSAEVSFGDRVSHMKAKGDTLGIRQGCLEEGARCLDSGLLDEARKCYVEILKSDARDFRVLTNFGVVYVKAGQYSEAIKYFDSAIAVNPRHAPAYWNRGRAHRLSGRFAEALRDCKTALEARPETGGLGHATLS